MRIHVPLTCEMAHHIEVGPPLGAGTYAKRFTTETVSPLGFHAFGLAFVVLFSYSITVLTLSVPPVPGSLGQVPAN
jgi:hypothetical protein